MLTTGRAPFDRGNSLCLGSSISSVRLVALAGVVALGVATADVAGGQRVSATCPASPVDGNYVHAGVIKGGIDVLTDVVDGHFRLRVGSYRDAARGLNQKILWSVPVSRRAGARLVVRGRTINGAKRTFVQKFWEAGTDDPANHYYPSIVSPPSAGCWRLTLTTGKLKNAVVARVDG
jgi:hypothetical protein